MTDATTAPEGVTEPVTLPFVPIPGQSFSCEQDWINRATRRLTAHEAYNNTEHGETKGWRGAHFTALCFDQAGNRMRQGADFMRATREGTYPVWWIWPDQIVPLVRGAEVDHHAERIAAEEDAVAFGTGFMVDGRRVHPSRLKCITPATGTTDAER